MLIEPAANHWGDGRPYRRGDKGWPVVALQLNLNTFQGNRLELDGDFGAATEKVAKAFQAHRDLTVDGVIGAVSQERMCIDLATPAARRYALPTGLARGAMENESSYALAAYTEHPSDSGFDLGAWQDSYTSPGTQQNYMASLNVSVMAYRTCELYRRSYDRYRAVGAASRLAWECAALYHNWPAAADRMARGLGPTTRPDEPAAWVQAASAGRLHTPREWAESYIAAATRYVEW